MMNYKLGAKLERAGRKAYSKDPIPIRGVREWSVLGQLITFFKDNPDEHLYDTDLLVKFSAFTAHGIYLAIREGLRMRLLQFSDNRLTAGSKIDDASCLDQVAPPRTSCIRVNSTLYRFLVSLKTDPTLVVEDEKTPGGKGYFRQFFGYAVAEKLVEIVYVGGLRHVKAGPNLASDPRIEVSVGLKRLHESMLNWKKMHRSEYRMVLSSLEFQLLFPLVDVQVKEDQ